MEILPSPNNKRLSVVIRKERLSIYESLTLDTAKEFLEELQFNIKILEEKNDKKI